MAALAMIAYTAKQATTKFTAVQEMILFKAAQETIHITSDLAMATIR